MRKEFETIAQYKEQMRAMLDKAEAEKRALDASVAKRRFTLLIRTLIVCQFRSR